MTRAMLASTIAEFFIEEDELRVELEIGPADLEASANPLPDEIYARLDRGQQPHAERLALGRRRHGVPSLPKGSTGEGESDG